MKERNLLRKIISYKSFSLYSLLFLFFLCMNCDTKLLLAITPPTISSEEQALQELRTTLKTQNLWVKVHAAEYLAWLGYSKEVKEEFIKENHLHGAEPMYRVGIWRVLSISAPNHKRREEWISRIFEAFQDLNGVDRLYAIETLAKLKISPLGRCPEVLRDALESDDRMLNIFAHWAVAYESAKELQDSQKMFLRLVVSDAAQDIRTISAFILRQLGEISKEQWHYLCEQAIAEPFDTGLRHTLLNTAFTAYPKHIGGAETFRMVKNEMLKEYKLFSYEKKIELALALAEKGNVSDLPILQSLLNDESIPGRNESDDQKAADARAAAAYAILNILKINRS